MIRESVVAMPHDARAIANFLLDYAESRSSAITLMALLKMIYFAHGWHLAKYGAPLIKNHFEAWKDGPVVRVVYDAFKGAGSAAIRNRACKIDPVTRDRTIVRHKLSIEESEFLKIIFDGYGHIHAFALSDITHNRGSPWDRVWNAPIGGVVLGMRISNDRIRDHFLASLSPARTH